MKKSSPRWFLTKLVVVGLALALLLLGGVLVLPEREEANADESQAGRPVAAKHSAGTPTPAPGSGVTVTVAPVTVRPIQRTVEVVGTFYGFEEVTVAPEVGGPVQKIHFDLGDVVRPGDVLLELDPVDYQLAAEEARREMESELAKLGLTTMPGKEYDVSQTPAVVRAANLEANTLAKYKRAQQLFRQNTIPEEELELAETNYRVAEANHRQAILEAQSILALARQKEAKLNTATDRLGETQMRVPAPTLTTASNVGTLRAQDVEYVVAQRMVSEGEVVSAMPATSAFRLVMDKLLKLRAAVPERYVGEVKMGQKVEVTTDAYPDKVFEGQITRVSPTVDRVSRTFDIEAVVPNVERLLKAGGFARAAILTRVEAQAVTVPTEALITFVGSTKVFVLRDGKAQSVPVTPGIAGRGWVEVSGAVRPGDQVITSGHAQLADGVPVRVRTAEAASGK